MFTEWMIASTPNREKGKTTIMTILSILFHVVIIAALVIIPILSSPNIPKYEVNAAFLAPPPPPPPPPPPKGGKKVSKKLKEKLKQLKRKQQEQKQTQALVAPLDIPESMPEEADQGLLEGLEGIGEGIEGGVEGGIEGGVEGGSLVNLVGGEVGGDIENNAQVLVQPPKRIKFVKPEYPDLAKKIRAQGVVILQCITDIYGNVVRIKVLSSPHPLLTKAAIDAVKQWKYEPWIVGGIPRPVKFTVTVKFYLK